MGCKTKWTTQMFAGKILDEKKALTVSKPHFEDFGVV